MKMTREDLCFTEIILGTLNKIGKRDFYVVLRKTGHCQNGEMYNCNKY